MDAAPKYSERQKEREREETVKHKGQTNFKQHQVGKKENDAPPARWPPPARRSPTPPCPSPSTFQGAPSPSARSRHHCCSGESSGCCAGALFPLPPGPPRRCHPCRRRLEGALPLLRTNKRCIIGQIGCKIAKLGGRAQQSLNGGGGWTNQDFIVVCIICVCLCSSIHAD